jgi:hypothetical protein
VAATIRQQLGVEPAMVHAGYGQFRVLVDGQPAIESGALGFLGVVPPINAVLDAVRERLGPARKPLSAGRPPTARRRGAR